MTRLEAVVIRRTCEDVVAVLQDFFEGSLDPKMAAAIERHFQDGPDCHAFSKTYKEVVQLAGELGSDDIPEEVRQRVRAAVHERAVRSR